MSIRYMNMAWKMPLNSTETIVLLALSDNSNEEGFCYPGYKSLMDRTKLSKSTLAKTLSILESAGFFSKQSHSEIGKGKGVNTYQLLFNESWFHTVGMRHELIESTRIELIEKIKELRAGKKRAISSHLEPRKVHTSNPISSHLEHESSVITISKEPSDSVPTSSEAVTTPKKAKAEKKPKEPKQSEIDALKIAEYLARKITDFNSTAKTNPSGWVKDIELAIRIDKRTPKELCEIITWIYTDNKDGKFWIKNIMSGESLRRQYDKMYMQKLSSTQDAQPAKPRASIFDGARVARL
jgi:hypothetical protein